ncbi:MAG: hypothetical protein KDA75_18245, partial [Planctomycetaceae bacterium]|nr:hypothetical protein [Planctomycetaceae bacterium]
LLTPDAANSLQQELRTAFEARSPAPWVTPLLLVPDAVQETRWQRDGSPFGMFVRSLDGLATGTGPDVDLTRVGSGVVRSIDPAAVNIPRPHYESTIKSNARRQAARVLSDMSR